jgi:hypothetical protein
VQVHYRHMLAIAEQAHADLSIQAVAKNRTPAGS